MMPEQEVQSVQSVQTTTPNARIDAWAALMTRIIVLAPNADPEQIKLLSSAYRDLV